MAHCSPRRSLRNRIAIAALPFVRALFSLQDAVYRLIDKTDWGVPTSPPRVPMSEAAPYAPEHGYIRDRHGRRLFYRAWPVCGPRARAVLVAVDGLGSYSEEFHPIGTFLAPLDIAFYGLDLLGQGMSDGQRDDWTALPHMIDGVADFVTQLGEWYPDRPVYLLGESLGGPLIMQLAGRSDVPGNLAGLILASCQLEVTSVTAEGGWKTALTVLKQVPFFFFASMAPSVDTVSWLPLASRGPEAHEIYERSRFDPLRNNCLSIRTLVASFDLVARGYAIAGQVRLPTLVLQGTGDEVNDPSSAAYLMPCLATGDKELAYFAGAAHGLFYDPDTPEVLQVIADWLERHLRRWERPAQRRASLRERSTDGSCGQEDQTR